MEGENIVVVGQQPWDTDIGSNCKNLAIELSKKNKVLYVNSPLDRITWLRGRNELKIRKRVDVIRQKLPSLTRVSESLWNLYPDQLVESINWLPKGRIFDLLNLRNNRILATSIKNGLLSLQIEDFILFNDNEMFKGFYLKEMLKPKLSIYYSRDFMLGVDYWKRHGERLEPLLITKSDLCFTNSLYLAEYCAQYNNEAHYIGQGCDLDIFDPALLPTSKLPELAGIDSPIIGYVGSLDSNRLDIRLIEYVARHVPEYKIVLVGPEDMIFRESTLHDIENIIFLGKKAPEELPYYINAFDICINPQLVNPITIGNYPRKIDEYLAMGKPTVATDTLTMEAFKDFVYLANTEEEFVAMIRQAHAENNPELQLSRREYASTHTWTNCLNEMSRHLNAYVKYQNG